MKLKYRIEKQDDGTWTLYQDIGEYCVEYLVIGARTIRECFAEAAVFRTFEDEKDAAV